MGPSFRSGRHDFEALRALKLAARRAFPQAAADYDYVRRTGNGGADYARAWKRSDAADRLRRYTAEFGWTVQAGPCAGLRYPSWAGGWAGDLAAKLAGSYEAGLHQPLESLVASQPAHVIDVGAAEGYYAVGLARRLPRARVLASDIDPVARMLCRHLARHNRVGRRVTARRGFEPGMVHGLAGPLAFIFDCEGAERDLIDPARVPELREARIIVELHEFVYRDVLDVLRGRLADTHTIEIHEETPFAPALDRLWAWDPADVQRLLDERRPEPMRWAVLQPRAGAHRA